MQELKFNKEKWKKVSLGEIVFEPKETAKSIVDEGFEHIVGLEHIDSNDIHLRKSFSADTDTTFTKVFREGDVLFGRRRAYLKKAAQAKFDGVCSGDITVLRAKANVDSRLLPFIIHNDKFFDHAIKHSAGGLSPRVKFKDLANYEFLLPPKEQQTELADLLWAIDEVIEKDLEVLKNTKKLKSAQIIDFSKSGKLSDLSQLITDSFTGGTPDTKNESFYTDGTIEWITTKEIYSTHTYKGEKLISTKAINESNSKILPANNLIVGIRVGVGKFSINKINISFSQDVLGLFINKEKVNLDYLINILNGEKFQKQIEKYLRGTTIKGILKNDILSIKFRLPLLEEQNKLTDVLNNLNSSISNLKSKLQSSKALQKSLINQIF